MNKINFVKTEDGSYGLFNEEIGDIFHSVTGAKKEAMDKFILPAASFLKDKTTVRILDICYGIGYNTKMALNYYHDKEIIIDALEYNYKLTLLSPFINDKICDDSLKMFLINKIFNNESEIYDFIEILGSICPDNSMFYFSDILYGFLCDLKFEWDMFYTSDDKKAFLHNIYYNYISNKYKYKLKNNKYSSCNFRLYIGDARQTITELTNTYDVVFLDAFTPQKDPTLWTIDFLSKVKNIMNKNSILLSYSKSTPFRSTLKELNFCVGKTFIDDIDSGTIAAFDESLINNPLTEYDFELINTKSGIIYKDPSLKLSSSEIIKNRELEQKYSTRLSHTAFLKKYSIK